MLQQQVDVNEASVAYEYMQAGDNPLMIAIREGYHDIIDLLLANDADVNHQGAISAVMPISAATVAM